MVSRDAARKRAAENDRGNFEFNTGVYDDMQLEAARAAAWHQTGEPLLTLEAARDWINERGLVYVCTPRGSQLPAPAPSLVEATLGAANGCSYVCGD